MPKDRFEPAFIIESPRQRARPDQKIVYLTPKDSLNLAFVREQMRPQTLAGLEYDGKAVDLRDSRASAESVRQGLTAPLGPWGELHLMQIDWGVDRPIGWIDIPEPVLSTSMRQMAVIIEAMQSEGHAVNSAINQSQADLGGKGLQSVKTPHFQHFILGLPADPTPVQIRNYRSGMRWDDGISFHLGSVSAAQINRYVLPNYKYGSQEAGEIEMVPDNMGFTGFFPGFKPQHLAEPAFIRDFWRPISLIQHSRMRDVFSRVFRGDLDEVTNYVATRKGPDEIDQDKYASFFERTEIGPNAPEYVVRLHELYDLGELRMPPGWVGGWQMTPKGAFFEFTTGILKGDLGGVELNGGKLIRPEFPVSEAEMARRTEKYHKYAEAALAAV